MKTLTGKVALVAGATRGAGRGIACMLGEAGATVYCTGRSTRQHAATTGRPETIEETAEMVTTYGGTGIPIQTDHTDESQVKTLLKHIENEQHRLDILVNDIWGGDALTEWGKPFWELSFQKGEQMVRRAIYSHLITSRLAVPLMIKHNSGLIVEVTDGDEAVNRHYRGNLFYDWVKTSIMRLAFGMARELSGKNEIPEMLKELIPAHDYNITALALTPGFLRSEAVLDHFGVTEANWRDAVEQDRYFAESETPFYIGRAVVALASDANVKQKSGQTLSTWNLAKEYGFTDTNGTQPDWSTVHRQLFPET